ncbi:transporter [Methylobacterium sp. WL103]|nr:transporter [Methylobacterium sp. WL103]
MSKGLSQPSLESQPAQIAQLVAEQTLTATKHFGKWEVGPVAFGSTDLPTGDPSYARQGQVAVGALVGYNFGPVNLQAYVTRDVIQRNYAGLETRGWLRVTVPIYQDKDAPPAASPVIRKF